MGYLLPLQTVVEPGCQAPAGIWMSTFPGPEQHFCSPAGQHQPGVDLQELVTMHGPSTAVNSTSSFSWEK